MATKSFVSTAEAPEETTALAAAQAPAAAYAASDIELPRLQFVQKMTDLDFEAPVGSIVLNRESVLYRPGVKVPAIVVAAQKFWKQDIPFDSDQQPAFLPSQEEADRFFREESNEFSFITCAYISLLIQKTSDTEDADAFPFDLDGEQWAIGKFFAQKKAYDTTFKRLATFEAFNPGKPISDVVWNLSSDLVTKGSYKWYVPSLSPTKGVVGPETAAFANRLSGGAQ